MTSYQCLWCESVDYSLVLLNFMFMKMVDNVAMCNMCFYNIENAKTTLSYSLAT